MLDIKRPLRRLALALAVATGLAGAAFDASAQGTTGTIINPAQQPNSLNPNLNPNVNLDPNATPIQNLKSMQNKSAIRFRIQYRLFSSRIRRSRRIRT